MKVIFTAVNLLPSYRSDIKELSMKFITFSFILLSRGNAVLKLLLRLGKDHASGLALLLNSCLISSAPEFLFDKLCS